MILAGRCKGRDCELHVADIEVVDNEHPQWVYGIGALCFVGVATLTFISYFLGETTKGHLFTVAAMVASVTTGGIMYAATKSLMVLALCTCTLPMFFVSVAFYRRWEETDYDIFIPQKEPLCCGKDTTPDDTTPNPVHASNASSTPEEDIKAVGDTPPSGSDAGSGAGNGTNAIPSVVTQRRDKVASRVTAAYESPYGKYHNFWMCVFIVTFFSLDIVVGVLFSKGVDRIFGWLLAAGISIVSLVAFAIWKWYNIFHLGPYSGTALALAFIIHTVWAVALWTTSYSAEFGEASLTVLFVYLLGLFLVVMLMAVLKLRDNEWRVFGEPAVDLNGNMARFGKDYFVPVCLVLAFGLLVGFVVAVSLMSSWVAGVATLLFAAVFGFFAFVYSRWVINKYYLEKHLQYAAMAVFVIIACFGVGVGFGSSNNGFTGFSISLWSVVFLLFLQGAFTFASHANDVRRVIISSRRFFPIYEYTPNSKTAPLTNKNVPMMFLIGALMVAMLWAMCTVSITTHVKYGFTVMYIACVTIIWLFVHFTTEPGVLLGSALKEVDAIGDGAGPDYINAVLVEALHVARKAHLYKNVDATNEMITADDIDHSTLQSEYAALYMTAKDAAAVPPINEEIAGLPNRVVSKAASHDHEQALAKLHGTTVDISSSDTAGGSGSGSGSGNGRMSGSDIEKGTGDGSSAASLVGTGGGGGADGAPAGSTAVVSTVNELQQAGLDALEKDAVVQAKVKSEQKFVAHFQAHPNPDSNPNPHPKTTRFQAHIVLAVRSHHLYNGQMLHGMMRLLGFEGNYKLKMGEDDEEFFMSLTELYKLSRNDGIEANRQNKLREEQLAKERAQLRIKALAMQKEKEEKVIQAGAKEQAVHDKTLEYQAQHKKTFGPGSDREHLREKRQKWANFDLGPTVLDSMDDADVSSKAQERLRASMRKLDAEVVPVEREIRTLETQISEINAKISQARCAHCKGYEEHLNMRGKCRFCFMPEAAHGHATGKNLDENSLKEEVLGVEAKVEEKKNRIAMLQLEGRIRFAEQELILLEAAIDREAEYHASVNKELKAVIAKIKADQAAGDQARREADEEERRRIAAEQKEEQRRQEEARRREEEAKKRTKKMNTDPQMVKYNQLVKSHVARGTKFEDVEFPASTSSVYIRSGRPSKGTQFHIDSWERPPAGAQITMGGYDADDIQQGGLGDCWFISAMSIVANQGTLYMDKIMAKGNAEVGIYAIKFQQGGRDRTVIIDDQLPVNRGSPAKLTFCHARDRKELWPALLEKAYAKLNGSYEALDGGRVDDGLSDLTGGIQSFIELSDLGPGASDGTLWHTLKSNMAAGFLMGCGSNSGSDTNIIRGIAQGHAYSILKVMEVQGQQLLQLRNPWGRTEWEGEWNDAWIKRNASSTTKHQLQFKDADDGIFWIKLPDFLLNFTTVYVVRVFQDGWKSEVIQSEWKGESAAGCSNYNNLRKNPQFLVHITKPTHFVAVLTQGDSESSNREYTYISMTLYNNGGKRVTRNCGKVLDTGTFTNLRTRTMQSERLEPTASGKPYTLLPCTFDPGSHYGGSSQNDSPFTITVYSDDTTPGSFRIEELR